MGSMEFGFILSAEDEDGFQLVRRRGGRVPHPLHGSHKNTLDPRLVFYVRGSTLPGWHDYHTHRTPSRLLRSLLQEGDGRLRLLPGIGGLVYTD